MHRGLMLHLVSQKLFDDDHYYDYIHDILEVSILFSVD